MSVNGIIKIPSGSSESIYKEKGSEFIAKAFPVKSDSDVLAYLEETKKQYYSASHHCYAFRLKDDSFRYSDAGEPNGTAGIRILNAIDHFELKDILVIVIRYFGGIKLGVGHLGKAYYKSVELLLNGCSFQEERPFRKVTIICEFSYISLIHRELSIHSSLIEKIEYGEKVKFTSLIPSENVEKCIRELNDSGKGKISLITEPELIYHNI